MKSLDELTPEEEDYLLEYWLEEWRLKANG
jgi:hypothetical protein